MAGPGGVNIAKTVRYVKGIVPDSMGDSMTRARKAGISLALGGGGARGFAHLGVFQVLTQRGIPVGSIVGTSSGAIAGAGLALGYDIAEMVERAREFAASPLANDPRVKAMIRDGVNETRAGLGDRFGRLVCQGRLLKSLVMEDSVLGQEFFRAMVEFFAPDVMIEAMPLPFAAVATDSRSGQTVILDRGPLREALSASCAVPGVAPLVRHQGRALMDGGVCSLVPTLEARQLGHARLLAVSVDRALETSPAEPRQALEIFLRAGDIQATVLNELTLRQADLVLRPPVGHLHWMDFVKAEQIVEAGRQETEIRLAAIERLAANRLGDRLGRAWRAARVSLGRRTAETF